MRINTEHKTMDFQRERRRSSRAHFTRNSPAFLGIKYSDTYILQTKKKKSQKNHAYSSPDSSRLRRWWNIPSIIPSQVLAYPNTPSSLVIPLSTHILAFPLPLEDGTTLVVVVDEGGGPGTYSCRVGPRARVSAVDASPLRGGIEPRFLMRETPAIHGHAQVRGDRPTQRTAHAQTPLLHTRDRPRTQMVAGMHPSIVNLTNAVHLSHPHVHPDVPWSAVQAAAPTHPHAPFRTQHPAFCS